MVDKRKLFIKAENLHMLENKQNKLYTELYDIAFCLVEKYTNGQYQYISQEDLLESGLSIDECFALACEQMVKMSSDNLEIHYDERMVVGRGDIWDITSYLLQIEEIIDCAVTKGMQINDAVIIYLEANDIIIFDFMYENNDEQYANYMIQKKVLGVSLLSYTPIKYTREGLEVLKTIQNPIEQANDLYKKALRQLDNDNNKEAIKLLEEIISMDIDEDFLSNVYATLGNSYQFCEYEENKQRTEKMRKKLLYDNMETARKYARKSLELKATNKVAPLIIMRSYLFQDKIEYMCETIAKYNLAIGLKNVFDKEKQEIQNSTLVENDICDNITTNLIMKKIFDHANDFQCLYQIHEKYPDSNYYTRLMISLAANTNHYVELCILYRDLFKIETLKNTRINIYFQTVCGKLIHMVLVNDKFAMRETMNQADSLFVNYQEQLDFKSILMYYGNKLNTLNALKEYDEVIRCSKEINSQYNDNTLLHAIAHAYLNLENYAKALDYAQAAISIHEDDMDLWELGRAYMGLKQYDKAVFAFVNAIRIVNQNNAERYKYQNLEIESVRIIEKDDALMDIYPMLIQAYIGLGEAAKAKAVFLEMKDNVKRSLEVQDTGLIFQIENQLIDREEEVKKEYEIIKKELENKNSELTDCINSVKEWSEKLIKCQVLDSEQVIDDDFWESSIKEQMNQVIDIMLHKLVKTESEEYNEIYIKVEERFPRMSKTAKQFLASAEQFYQCFKNNLVIDYAPVMVEYCRVIDKTLWDYLENSTDYISEVNRCVQEGREKTLGSGVYIAKTYKKPLASKYDILNEIKRLRNGSAHINQEREPDVEWIRSVLWDTDLLDIML